MKNVDTYLSQEGFIEEGLKGWYSLELNTHIYRTLDPNLFNVTVDGHTYVDLWGKSLPDAVDALNNYTDTQRLVALYNLQKQVLEQSIYGIKEDI